LHAATPRYSGAALGIGAVCERAVGRWRTAFVTGIALLLALQIAIAVKIAALRVRDDTHEIAAAWIVDHPEAAPFHIGPTVHLPLAPLDAGYRAELPLQRKFLVPWTANLLRLDPATRARIGLDLRDPPVRKTEERVRLERDPDPWLTGLGPGTLLVERFFDGRRPTFQALRAALVRRTQPVAIFHTFPIDVPGARPIDYMLDSSFAPEDWFAWSILWCSRLGPEIEAYPTGD